jgi:hypothetical protein
MPDLAPVTVRSLVPEISAPGPLRHSPQSNCKPEKMSLASLSSVTANRGVALKAPRATAFKARVATRVQAVRPRPGPIAPAEKAPIALNS